MKKETYMLNLKKYIKKEIQKIGINLCDQSGKEVVRII